VAFFFTVVAGFLGRTTGRIVTFVIVGLLPKSFELEAVAMGGS
jgi:hypothetical protein